MAQLDRIVDWSTADRILFATSQLPNGQNHAPGATPRPMSRSPPPTTPRPSRRGHPDAGGRVYVAAGIGSDVVLFVDATTASSRRTRWSLSARSLADIDIGSFAVGDFRVTRLGGRRDRLFFESITAAEALAIGANDRVQTTIGSASRQPSSTMPTARLGRDRGPHGNLRAAACCPRQGPTTSPSRWLHPVHRRRSGRDYFPPSSAVTGAIYGGAGNDTLASSAARG
jgi:hypothetical protein